MTRWEGLTPLPGVQVVSSDSKLEVTVTAESAAYTCRVTVKNYPELVKKATVWRKGPARVLVDQSPQLVPARWEGSQAALHPHLSKGYEGHLRCVAFAIPPSTSVDWSFDGAAISAGAKYSVTQEADGHTITSTLTIHNLGLLDFGWYNCSVANPLGASFLPIELRMQGRRRRFLMSL